MRCAWADNEEMRTYHDVEWGVPEHSERRLYELLTLEGAQAGLSWSTILRRREHYREAFAGFDADRVASFTSDDVQRLLTTSEIVRHRGKIESTINNAQRMVQLWSDDLTLDELLWGFVDGVALRHDWSTEPTVAARTPLSTAMSKELKRRGFRFVGPTTCYALMQAAGLVNDHDESCFRFAQV